jgi:hypothetical protein
MSPDILGISDIDLGTETVDIRLNSVYRAFTSKLTPG